MKTVASRLCNNRFLQNEAKMPFVFNDYFPTYLVSERIVCAQLAARCGLRYLGLVAQIGKAAIFRDLTAESRPPPPNPWLTPT
jgi:hypothetical protein